MTIHTIGGTSLAIYLSDEELRTRNLAPAAVTAADTAQIVHNALSQLGINKCENIYTELFPGRNDLLLFVRIISGERIYYSFDSFEALLSAVSVFRDAPPSALYWFEERYILSLHYLDNCNEFETLCEFGERLRHPPLYSLHLTEHGKQLIHENAIKVLHSLFKS